MSTTEYIVLDYFHSYRLWRNTFVLKGKKVDRKVNVTKEFTLGFWKAWSRFGFRFCLQKKA